MLKGYKTPITDIKKMPPWAVEQHHEGPEVGIKGLPLNNYEFEGFLQYPLIYVIPSNSCVTSQKADT